MLNWSQDVLAQEAGLSLNTIHSLEKGFSSRSVTLVRKILEKKGIEFFGSHGISRRGDDSVTYSGSEGASKFYDDMLATAKEHGGEMIACFKTAEIMARSLNATDKNNQKHLEQLSKFASVKCLLSENVLSPFMVSLFEYKATAQPHIRWPLSIIACGNKHAVILSQNGTDFFYYVSKDIESVQKEYAFFAPLWNEAWSLPNSKA